MQITQVHTIPIDTMRHGVLGYLVQVETDAGITGLGEVAADCHPATVAFAIGQMNLQGRDPMAVEALWQSLYQSSFWRGGPIWTSAISGVEQALWDIKGKHLGVPVYQLLGGKLNDRIKLYTHTLFGDQSPEQFADSARQAVDAGFQAVKFDPLSPAQQRMDIKQMRTAFDRVRATRQAVGDDIDILIEGHGRLSPNMAIRMARRFEEFDPFFFEEPVAPENIDEMAKVAAAVNIPLAAGERLYTRWSFRELLEKQAVDYIQPDLCHCGGFFEGFKIATLAETYHVRVLPHNPNGPISTLVGVHLGACTANFEMLEYPRRPADQIEVLGPMPRVQDGYIEVPDGPGWGVEVDEEALAPFKAEV
ncbi:MAG: galactonate dehydratase [Candidatus Latescibacteria bacterium]|nr:galactonate dehydratase [Candidatus Latescibacterota bacterium]